MDYWRRTCGLLRLEYIVSEKIRHRIKVVGNIMDTIEKKTTNVVPTSSKDGGEQIAKESTGLGIRRSKKTRKNRKRRKNRNSVIQEAME